MSRDVGKSESKQVIPVIAHNESRTLYYRESKCFFGGPEILMGTNYYTRMSELGY